jgi:RNA polymerase sigma-70 factor, ECF subfamily
VIVSQESSTFEGLYRTFHPEVRAYCLRRLGRDQADDAADDVFAVLWRRRLDLPPDDEILPFAYGVARRVVSSRQRATRRLGRLTGRLAGLGGGEAPVDEVVVMHEERRMVLRALRLLSDDDQEVLRLSAWEGLSNRQVATALGITAGAADQRLSRAKRRLARAYQRIEGSPERSVP